MDKDTTKTTFNKVFTTKTLLNLKFLSFVSMMTIISSYISIFLPDYLYFHLLFIGINFSFSTSN